MAISSSPVKIDVQNGLAYVYYLQVCTNNSASCPVSTLGCNNGVDYTVSQNCGENIQIGFNAMDSNGNFLTNFEVELIDQSTGDVRTATTDSTGYASFDFELGCHLFNAGYTLDFYITAKLVAPSYTTKEIPFVVVNVS